MIDDDCSMERNDTGRRVGKREAWIRALEQSAAMDSLLYGDPLYSIRKDNAEAAAQIEAKAAESCDLAIRKTLSRRGLWGLGMGLHTYNPRLLGGAS